MQLNIGDFGYWEFDIFKKTKYKVKYREITNIIKGHYEVLDLDAKNVLLGDGQKELIVTRWRIIKFEKKVKPKK